MNLLRGNRMVWVVFVVSVLLLGACTTKGAEEQVDGDVENTATKLDKDHEDKNREPVTMNLFLQFDWEYIKEDIENEFPFITVEHIRAAPDEWEDKIAQGVYPDLIWYEGPRRFLEASELELPMDLDPLIEKHNYDLSRFQPEIIETLRSFTDNSELYALPKQTSPYALHYNKTIFDEFGVDYPSDDMTWTEVADLARQVTGERNGVHYYGLLPRAHDRALINYTLLDPDTDEPIIDSTSFIKTFMETFQNIYAIPDNLPENEKDLLDPRSLFGNGQLAMMPIWSSITGMTENPGNVDIATYPSWDEFPNTQPESRSHSIGIASTAQDPDLAFEVLSYLVSDEYLMNKTDFEAPARLPFSDQSLINEYEVDPIYQDLHLEALSKHPFAKGPAKRSKYELTVMNELIPEMITEIAYTQKDVNTVLRETQEKAEALVKDLKANQ